MSQPLTDGNCQAGPIRFSPREIQIWTRKEAYVKAIGDGLAIPLNRSRVTLLPAAPTLFVQIAGDTGIASDWTLHHLEPAPGYVGALAYRDSQRPTTIHPALRADELPDVLRAYSGTAAT